MATKKTANQDVAVQALVLVDCAFGKSGEVVTLPAADAEIGEAHGMLDTNPEAVKAK
jgi:hypothetical protein